MSQPQAAAHQQPPPPTFTTASLEATRSAILSAAARDRPRQHPPTVQETSPPTTTQPTPSSPALTTYNLKYCTDSSPQGWVPLRIIAPATAPGTPPTRHPAVVFLHATGSSKGAMTKRMVSYASSGYVTAAIDCRYHGDRADPRYPTNPREGYEQALVEAWRGSGERPFLLDNVWDLIHLLDVLEQREDVDDGRIGMTGVSLGGMHTWLTAAADVRVVVAAPVIGVQGFRWAVDNHQYQGRVESIPTVFEAAAHDLEYNDIDAHVVRSVWKAIMPGLLDQYDAPQSLGCIAPRPLLIVNGELDPRCPIPGLKEAVGVAEGVYKEQGAEAALKLRVVEGVGHQETDVMKEEVRRWFDEHFLKGDR